MTPYSHPNDPCGALQVALLLEATEEDPRLSVSVRDNDGEFLVIEAAGALPAEMEAWLEPDTSKVGWLVGWSVGWLVGWLVGWGVRRLVCS